MVLQLQIEMIRAEDLRHFQGVVFGVFVFPVPQHPGQLTGQTGRQGDQALAVLPQQLHINAGFDVKALCPGHGNHIGEVAIALFIFTQQHQMAALCVKFVDLVKPGAVLGRHIDFTADDGLDSLRLAGAVEINHTVHDAVVCNGAGRLAQLPDRPGQVPDAAGAVQQAELRMDM